MAHKQPPLRKSEESNRGQLQLARRQGDRHPWRYRDGVEIESGQKSVD